uniref:GLOBIN domain-containing protein n=1 Tax=Steinernema glaseri TaxID=37863 RepID=A0A1I8ABA2_9BILA
MGNAKSSEKSSEESPQKRASPKINEPKKSYKKKVSMSSKGAGSARSSMSSESGRKAVLLTGSQRQIIKYCMENAKADLGERIYRRVIEKRDDFRGFVDNLSRAERTEMSEALRDFLKCACSSLHDLEELQSVSESFGERHVGLRTSGFKPDFFATIANEATTECIFLDCAVHAPSETLTAWSQLTSTIFSSVRDGYYTELRRLRRSSNCFYNGRAKNSIDMSTDGSTRGDEESRRSVSPGATDVSGDDDDAQELRPTESSNYLLPPTSSNYLLPPTVY